LATAPYCVETNSVILEWHHTDFKAIPGTTRIIQLCVGNQQSITLSLPRLILVFFTVDIVPYVGYGCRDTVNAIVTHLYLCQDTPVTTVLFLLPVTVRNKAFLPPGFPDAIFSWYNSATGGVGSKIGPIPSTAHCRNILLLRESESIIWMRKACEKK
jgi:hypothetical protein